MPAGMTERLKIEALIDTHHEVNEAEHLIASFETLKSALKDCLASRDAKKHMIGQDLGRQKITLSLVFIIKMVR